MTLALTGSSGFVGSFLKEYFRTKGYKIISVTRDDFNNINSLNEKISQADIIINLVGANIIQRWTDEYKKILYNSRIDNTKKIVEAINSNNKKQTLLSTSAVGIYCDDEPNNEEEFKYGNTFLTKICKDWEDEAQKANARVLICRFGVVLGNGGALKKMLLPFKLGLGGRIGDGKQSFSYIHICDLARAYDYLIQNDMLRGVFNFCSPHSTTNEIYTQVLSHTLNRPAIFPLPVFVLKVAFGEGSTVLTNGQNVYPKKLLDNGFKFKFEYIEEVMADLLK